MNVNIWQRWTVGTVTTRGVVAQMLTSDMGHKQDLTARACPLRAEADFGEG